MADKEREVLEELTRKIQGINKSVELDDTDLICIDHALLALQELLPKEKMFGKEFNEDSDCDKNYVLGYNRCLADCRERMRGAGNERN